MIKLKSNSLNKNIVLVGFMGTGKTSSGKLLARKMKRKFIDTDELIEKKAKLSIKDIFAKYGEKYFRKLEKSAIKKAAEKKNVVISTGGGVVKDPLNVKRLKKNGFVIALFSNERVILRRAAAQKDKRPLLDAGSEKESLKRLKALLSIRRPLYKAAADMVLDTSRWTPKQTAKKILCELKKVSANI